MDDHGFISRSFIRRYPIPADFIMEDFDGNVMCELSSDSVLTITIPRKRKEAENGVDGGKVSSKYYELMIMVCLSVCQF